MRIIAVSHLRAFWKDNPDAEQPLKSWADEVKKATWRQPADIKDQYRNASVLKNRRVVFNIKGNDYRLVVSVAYRFQAVYGSSSAPMPVLMRLMLLPSRWSADLEIRPIHTEADYQATLREVSAYLTMNRNPARPTGIALKCC